MMRRSTMGRRMLPGPGDIYLADIAREEREQLRRARAAHDEGEDCGDPECDRCEDKRTEEDTHGDE